MPSVEVVQKVVLPGFATMQAVPGVDVGADQIVFAS